MPQPVVQVDAFAGRPFAGNPAAVCIMDASADEGWMQRVAVEMNLSATAFLHPEKDGWGLRWFTPRVEVALCGHATLASAHVLWEEGRLAPDAGARFHTASGVLTAVRQGEWISMDFPARPDEEIPAPDGLEQALGTRPRYVGRSRDDLLVEVETEEVLRALRPDFGLLAGVEARGVIVTAQGADERFDFLSRFFAPRAGINEDPVTGSAHCVLAPFWAGRLRRDELTGYQASPRGGVVKVRAAGDRVVLAGQAVTVMRGELVA